MPSSTIGVRFEIAEGVAPAALEAAERDREGELEVLDRVGVDLLERREPVALVIAVVEQPVLRLLAALSARSNVMSAARTGVSAVAMSSGPINAIAGERILIALPPRFDFLK